MAANALGLRSCLAQTLRKASPTFTSRSTPRIAQWKTQAFRNFSCSRSLSAKKYTEDHEWVELSADGKIGTVGITEYAAKQLGDVVFVELPQKELELKKGDSMGAVESVKSASDIMTPLSGTVLETNSSLEEKPAGINKDPEGEGWLAKLDVKDESELTDLMDAEAYKSFTEES